jgi:hypothetical protein
MMRLEFRLFSRNSVSKPEIQNILHTRAKEDLGQICESCKGSVGAGFSIRNPKSAIRNRITSHQ